MYVVIAGGGAIGQAVAKALVDDRHDVVVIDRDRATCEEISAHVGALAINGLGTRVETLEEAGIRKADVAVGAMPTDADNLAFGVLARNFGVPRVIARMRNPRYESAYKLAGIYKPLSAIEMFVRVAVPEIELPTVRQVGTFGDGKATIVVVTMPEKAKTHGMAVKDIAQDRHFPNDCVIAGILRGDTGDFVFPRGAAEVRSGDQVFLVANEQDVKKAAQFLLRTK
jgi:trk system potassium uptake protein TrkA